MASLVIKAPISHARLRALVRELKSAGCQVRLDRRSWRLELDVPVRAGGLARVLASYSDIVGFHPGLDEVADEGKGLPKLPMPGRRERMKPRWKLLRKFTST